MTTSATPSGVRSDHVVVPPDAATADGASLAFDNGLERLRLRSEEHLDAMLEARFGEPLPVMWAAENTIHVEYPLGARLLRRAQPSAILLNPAPAWSFDVHGGATHLDADLSLTRLRAVSIHSGLALSRLVLGRPAGERVIRLSSVKQLRIERPADIPVRIELANGATDVSLDNRRYGAFGNRLTDRTPGYDTAENRYLLIASAAVDGLTITHRGRPQRRGAGKPHPR